MTSEYLAPTILSSRRLFGPNLFSERPGAVLEVVCHDAAGALAVDRWPGEVARLTTALGWTQVATVVLRASASANLFLTAPVDGLLTASDLSEYAWVAAEASVSGSAAADATATLRESYTRERQTMPHVVAIQQYARDRALCFSLDDASCSVGSGEGVHLVVHADTPLDESTEFDEAWDDAHDVPLALVTGSNGKTTTVRVLAAMLRASGRVTGWCCSDGVWVDDTQLERGDFTGPGGTRRVISDQRVQAAVLEVARGGLLRRGLAVSVADAAIITNISADHFGEYGVESLADLARVKAIVARALRPGASLTLNADDASLVSMAASPACAEIASQISWFSVQPGHRARTLATNGRSYVITDDNRLVLFASGSTHDLGDIREMPITLRGTATHNIANVAGAALVASNLGVPHHAIRATLQSFGSARSDNPGRLMLRELAGVTIVMDYAHNPDGIASLCRTAAALPARRRLLLLGQAGNRDDEQLRALGAAAWATQAFDRVIIKEMPAMLRGREAGDIPARLREGLAAAGAPSSRIDDADGELTGVQMALAWAQPGDLLVLGVHVERERVLDLMERLAEMQWHPGAPLPQYS